MSSEIIKYALAQELKSKAGVSGVRYRIYLLCTPKDGCSNGGEIMFLFFVY